MFALQFRFPAGRYHATPWGRNVNEADVAWPPEPWRLLRALIAVYWRKADHKQWPKEVVSRLIDLLAETLPVYGLPEGVIHAHTRHYMPTERGKPTLVFDAFVRIPEHEMIVSAWPDVVLDDELLTLATDLAAAIGYLGRAESWTECDVLTDWRDGPNCGPVEAGFRGDHVRLLAPLSLTTYAAERLRLIAEEQQRIASLAKKPPSSKRRDAGGAGGFRSKNSGINTLPERLIDALSLDTADYQDRGWHRPPAAREVLYACAKSAVVTAAPSVARRRTGSFSNSDTPTVARYLLAGRPRPRIEDTIRMGELMRRAALSQYGWRLDESKGRRLPRAPWQVSGRDADGNPLRNPSHSHAYWLPEDADSDGSIDHISVFIAGGIDAQLRANLDRITRLWIARERQAEDVEDDALSSLEWRLALEGFGRPSDFADGARIFGRSPRWRSVTPFLAAGHLKAAGYPGEFRRLIKRVGMDRRCGFDVSEIEVSESQEVSIGGAGRRALHFHRFRSRGREKQYDTMGAFLEVTFPRRVDGPLALGYGSHFGLGLFAAIDGD